MSVRQGPSRTIPSVCGKVRSAPWRMTCSLGQLRARRQFGRLAGCMVVRAPMASMNRTMIYPVSSQYSLVQYARPGIHLFRRSEVVESPSHGQELVRQFPRPHRSEDRSVA